VRFSPGRQCFIIQNDAAVVFLVGPHFVPDVTVLLFQNGLDQVFKVAHGRDIKFHFHRGFLSLLAFRDGEIVTLDLDRRLAVADQGGKTAFGTDQLQRSFAPFAFGCMNGCSGLLEPCDRSCRKIDCSCFAMWISLCCPCNFA